MQTQKLDAMLSGMMDCLKENGCAASYLSKIGMECRQFKRCVEKLGATQFDLAMCEHYLAAKYGKRSPEREKRTSHHEFVIRLMGWMKEYAESGNVRMVQQSSRIYTIPHYEDVLQSYLYCQEQNGLKPKTIAHKRHCLLLLFEYLETIGVTSVQKVNAGHFYGYLESKTYLSITTKEATLYVLRDFIRYLTDRNLCNPKLSGLFPMISTHGKNAYPSYFKNDEVKRLVQSADAETAVGKRDYAVLLLAAELGLRAGDIVALQTDHFLWNERSIELFQQKTGKFLSLPMSEELFFAMLDYVKNGRPASNRKTVFLAMRAPYQPLSTAVLYQRLQMLLCKAGVEPGEHQRHGMHALRSSLASNMLMDGASIIVVSSILGHQYTDTARHYIKIDIPELRKAALEVSL